MPWTWPASVTPGIEPPGAGYALWDYAPDVLRAAEQLGLKRFALLGHSMGAIVSLVLAVGSLPERVTHLGLIDGVDSSDSQRR